MDLDEMIRTELSAQADLAPDPAAVLAGARKRARTRRRNRAAVAGTAVGAILTVGIPYAVLHDGPAPAPAATAPSPTAASSAEPSAAPPVSPQDRALIDKCTAVLGHGVVKQPPLPNGDLPAPPDTDDARVLAVYRDQQGSLAWIGGAAFDWHCALRRDGTVDAGQSVTRSTGLTGVVPRERDYLPAGTGAREDQLEDVLAGKDRAGQWMVSLTATGRVSPEVRRVVVRLDGNPRTVTATVEGPYWIVRQTIVVPETSSDTVIRAYDEDGRLVG